MSDDEILTYFVEMARLVAGTLSPITETVVSDLRVDRLHVIAIFNGHISGRKVGDSVSSLSLKRLSGEVPDSLLAYEGLGQHNQRLKSSAMAIRNAEGELIGSFGINMDLSPLDSFHHLLSQLAHIETQTPQKELFSTEAPRKTIRLELEQLAQVSGWSLDRLSRKQKRWLVEELAKKGGFYRKGAVSIVAEILNITRPSIYRYLHDAGMSNGNEV